jgi:hypothetical protein
MKKKLNNKKEKVQKVSIYCSNKSEVMLLYNEKTGMCESEGHEFKAGKHMLLVFDVGWEKVGEL